MGKLKRFSCKQQLTIMFAAMVFLFMFFAMLIVFLGAFLLYRLGLVHGNRSVGVILVLFAVISLLVGAVLSLVNLVRLLLSYPGNELVCVTVTLSLFATVVLAKTIGGALPMLAKLVRADPAIMAAPLITTIVDALSLVLYFTIASRLLHL